MKYSPVGWDDLTITTGNGDIYEVPWMAHGLVLSGGFTPGSFQVALEDKKAEDLDALVGGTTPAVSVLGAAPCFGELEPPFHVGLGPRRATVRPVGRPCREYGVVG